MNLLHALALCPLYIRFSLVFVNSMSVFNSDFELGRLLSLRSGFIFGVFFSPNQNLGGKVVISRGATGRLMRLGRLLN